MRMLFPERFIMRHVGGNTTYARRIMNGVQEAGIETGLIPAGRGPISTMMSETLFGLRSLEGSVLHYTGDTGPLVRTRTPSVVTVHGVASRWTTVSRDRVQESVWRTRVKRAIDSCDRVITVSRSSAADVAEIFGVQQDDIAVIPHGIDVSAFGESRVLSTVLADVVTSPFILYLGNIEPRKNLVSLIRGYAQSRLAQEGVQLILAGQLAWDYQPTLEALRETPGAVHIGFVSDDDRVALMQSCELFVFPSVYEGFGFPVLEAMASGAVVLTTRAGALAEIAGPALSIQDDSAEGIATALRASLYDEALRRDSLVKAPAWLEQFSWDVSVSRHLDVYQSLVAG